MTGPDFDEFYRAEYAGLVALAAAVLGRRNGADDLVQDAMVEAYRRWPRLRGYEAPRAWVRRVMVQRAAKGARKQRNEAHAHLRTIAHHTTTHHTTLPPSSGEPQPELLVALSALPQQQRAAMALYYLEDLSVNQVADLLGVAEGTVKAHLSRGRLRLASDLAAHDDTTDDRGPR